MLSVTTLHRLRRHLGLAPTDTADDDRLRRALAAATAQISQRAGRVFLPYHATIRHAADVDRTQLLLSADLLELIELHDGDGRLLPLDAVLPLPEDGPASLLLLLDGRTFTAPLRPARAIFVTGVWGWHDDYAHAWQPSGENTALSATATSLTVTNANAATPAGESPRFSAGQLLRLENEYLQVLAVAGNTPGDTLGDTLTLARGVQGTTASAHPGGTPIEVYQPPAGVEHLALRWAAWLYRSLDTANADALPPHLLTDLEMLRRVRV